MRKYPSDNNNDPNYRAKLPGSAKDRFFISVLIVILVFLAIVCGPVIAKFFGLW